MLGEEVLKNFTKKNYQKKITKVNDRIYHFLGYGHSNCIAIIGDTSIIMIDTLDSDLRANIVKEELKKITDKPVKTIIYTHGHPDHRGGAGAFKDTVEEVISFSPQKPMLKYYDRLDTILQKRGSYQHGYGLTDEEAICQGIGIREGKEVNEGNYDFLLPTTVYDTEVVERVIDGVSLKLISVVGETDDQICIWLKEDKVICTGDNYYGCFPALYAIRGTQYRDIASWIDSLEKILSFDAIALLPGHTKPLLTKESIQKQVGMFKDAIEYILMTTLECMNQGMSISQTVEYVKLPKQYQEVDFLKEYYGMVEWAVRSIYVGYVGWFDGNAVNLLPVSDIEYTGALLELIGDINKVVEYIKVLMHKEQYQLALQLLELINDNGVYNEIKKEALLQRAKQVTSANARHYYIASAKSINV